MKSTVAAFACLLSLRALAAPLPDAQARAIDGSVQAWLARTGAPSVSIAVVENGALAYAHAYGRARLSPDQAATTDTRYAIDSVSKQFTAAAVLILQQDGKLHLDDPVSKYLGGVSGGRDITIRELLEHTSGLRDYWPQDFVPVEMTRPVALPALLAEWAGKPLDFKPGTDWQYSNTGYAVAGAIVQRVSGEPLMSFLRQHIFAPLHMDHMTEDDTAPLPAADAGAYTRAGLGPVRLATKEGAGWLFGASELAADPSTLARWDISLINRSLLQPASYDAMFRPTKFRNGRDTGYGLGEEISVTDGRLEISHGGEGSGFLAANAVWPHERVAIVALTNEDWADPEGVVARVAYLTLPPTAAEARARAVFAGFQHGTVDRALFTADGNAFLTPAVLRDQQAGLGSLGPIRTFELKKESLRGGMRTRIWSVATDTTKLTVIERAYPKGRIEQFTVAMPE